jgi:hypothetical protein
VERFQQVCSDSFVTEQLPDGSIAVFDKQSKGVYFLNASAAAAWEACRGQADAAAVARSMQATLQTAVSVETALAALAELEEKHLVESCHVQTSDVGSSDMAALASRRSMLKTIGAAAGALAPIVLAMTAAEQKAYAFQGGSNLKTSDARLKEDLRLITRLFGLNLYTFRFIGSQTLRVGLIAQEVYLQYPEAVIRGGADPQTQPWKIDYAVLVRRIAHPQAYVLQELALANSH